MSIERSGRMEANALDHAGLHLAEPKTDSYPILMEYCTLAENLLNSIKERELDLLPRELEWHYRRRLVSVRQLIDNSTKGLVLPGVSYVDVSKIQFRIAKEFKDVTGLDDEPAKAWADRAGSVLDNASTLEPLSEEDQAFMSSDIIPFLERLIKRPEEDTPTALPY